MELLTGFRTQGLGTACSTFIFFWFKNLTPWSQKHHLKFHMILPYLGNFFIADAVSISQSPRDKSYIWGGSYTRGEYLDKETNWKGYSCQLPYSCDAGSYTAGGYWALWFGEVLCSLAVVFLWASDFPYHHSHRGRVSSWLVLLSSAAQLLRILCLYLAPVLFNHRINVGVWMNFKEVMLWWLGNTIQIFFINSLDMSL